MDDPRIHLQASPGASGFAITVKRNCSISPRALAWLLAATAALNLGVGIAFAWLGLWLVLPFAGIEIAALTVAFYVNGRHAGDYERLVGAPGRLTLEVRDADSVRTWTFNPGWVRLVVQELRMGLRVALASRGDEIEIGRHLDGPGRERYAQVLRERLARI